MPARWKRAFNLVRGVIHRSGGVRSITSCLIPNASTLAPDALFITGSFHMGITSSLVTALSGLATSQQQIDVVGNNIANVNTIGYKATTVDFRTQFLQNFSFGSAPTSTSGGTNPVQVGLGATSGAITTDFTDGSLQTTGVPTDLAIQGNGFFVLQQGTQQVYTRDGTFQLNDQNQLVSSTGQLVQGYGIDSNFNIVPGTLTNLTIPIGTAAVAQATTTASFSGSLNANGSLPTTVSNLTLTSPMYLLNSGSIDLINGPAPTDVLTNVAYANGTAIFQVNDVLTLKVSKGTASTSTVTGTGSTSSTANLTVTSTTTLQDLENFMNGTIGIDTSAGANSPIATLPGTTAVPNTDPTALNSDILTVLGNPGAANDISLDNNALTINRGGTVTAPFSWNDNASANGESVKTQQTVYDSLGTPITLNVVATLTGKSSAGTTWQYYATSPDGSGTGANQQDVVGTGTLTFDTSGKLVNSSNSNVTINRTNTGALPALNISLDFSGITALAGNGTASTLLPGKQDGFPSGTLTKYSIGNDGTIEGFFNNGLQRAVGQVALATFQNDEGLVNEGNNSYIVGPNSGAAVITTAGSLSAGTISAGSLEGSNVDLSSEFVKLISASTAFSASSRVITSSNQLLQDLLSAAR
jgi:flagellar hook protein FlgE